MVWWGGPHAYMGHMHTDYVTNAMFTNTLPPLHAPQAAARFKRRCTYSYHLFLLFLVLYAFSPTRLSLRVSLSTRLSTRLFLRVYFYASLSTRLSLRVSLYASPFLYKRGTGETRAAEARAETRVEA